MAVYPQGSPNPPGLQGNQQMSVTQQIKQQMHQQQMAQHYATMLGANQQAQGTQSPDNQVRVQVNKMTGPALRLIKLILAILGTVSLHSWLVWGHLDTNGGDIALGWLVSIFIAALMWVLLHGAVNYILRGDPTKDGR